MHINEILIGPPSLKIEYKIGKNIRVNGKYFNFILKLFAVPKAIVKRLNIPT